VGGLLDEVLAQALAQAPAPGAAQRSLRVRVRGRAGAWVGLWRLAPGADVAGVRRCLSRPLLLALESGRGRAAAPREQG
jgi:hypothetical protein